MDESEVTLLPSVATIRETHVYFFKVFGVL
jgi:hypothetical protein